MSHGPIRKTIEEMKRLAKVSGLSLEQVADFYDAVSKIHKLGDVSSTSSDTRPNVPAPKGVQ